MINEVYILWVFAWIWVPIICLFYFSRWLYKLQWNWQPYLFSLICSVALFGYGAASWHKAVPDTAPRSGDTNTREWEEYYRKEQQRQFNQKLPLQCAVPLTLIALPLIVFSIVMIENKVINKK